MPSIPCHTKVDCPGDDGVLRNISAELPDKELFIGNQPSEYKPPLGGTWITTACQQVCVSEESQEDADLCAARLADECVIDNNFPPPVYFRNTAQTCVIPCAPEDISYTFPAGTYLGNSQEEANELAYAAACEMASIICEASGVVGNTAATYSRECSSGETISFPVPANAFYASTQGEADVLAFNYAISVLDRGCPVCQNCPSPPDPGDGDSDGGTNPPEAPTETSTPKTKNTVYYNSAQTCEVECSEGTGFSITIPSGLFAGITQLIANRVAFSVACKLSARFRLCFSELPTYTLSVGTHYELPISLSGKLSTNNNLWSISSGQIPTGMVLSILGKNIQISGTPTTTGDFIFRIKVEIPNTITPLTPNGIYAESEYEIQVVAITTSSPLPDGNIETPYSQTLAQSGVPEPVVWSIISGSLPDGLTLNEITGEISGTPTNGVASSFRVQASNGDIQAQKDFDLEIVACQLPDWACLEWDTATDLSTPGNVATFTPQNEKSEVFTITLQFNNEVEPTSAGILNKAVILNNGSSHSCQCSVNFSTGFGPVINGYLHVGTTPAGVDILSHSFLYNSQTPSPNPQVPSFTIPDSVTIVYVEVFFGFLAAITGETDTVQGTFSIV